MGTAELCSNGRFEAGSINSFTLTYTCGKFGLDESGTLRVVFRSANDQTPLQTRDPRALGYVTAEASNGSPLDIRYEPRVHVRPWFKALTITAKQFLREGDGITIRLGDQRGGSPGFRLQTFCESRFTFRVLADPIATGVFTPLPVSPVIAIGPGPVSKWKALLPSHCHPGEAFSLFIKAEDKWGNPTDQAEGILGLRSDQEISGLPRTIEFSKGSYRRVIEGLSLPTECDGVIDLLAADGQILSTTNQLRVKAGGPRRYWSDLHGQTEETIGTNSAQEYFEFARDLAFLDICGHQGNDFQIDDAFWEELNKTTAKFHQENRFVTVPGYEWSGNTGVGGDHNVWYRNEGRPIFRSSTAMVDVATDDNTTCLTSGDLFTALRDEDVIVSAHCGGRYADIKFAHDAQKEPSVEVHSCWGSFEWIVQDALRMGYRVGIVAASDDHKGRPGASHPGASKFGAYGGLTCHLMDELSRDALFSSFRRRHHYATTGARIWLDVSAQFRTPGRLSLDNKSGGTRTRPASVAMMGDLVALEDPEYEFNVEVLGTAPIERIELRDGLDVVEIVRPYAPSDLGRRIRVIWEGAETRGRGRNVTWDGKATLIGNQFERVQAINFWNAEKPIQSLSTSEVSWQSFTTGSFSGFEAVLVDGSSGTLRIEANPLTMEMKVRDIGFDDKIFDAGGLEKRIRIFRLPNENNCRRVTFSRALSLRKTGETRPYICVTQEDGNRAWSSPLYLSRRNELVSGNGEMQ
jgi:hypothetical protein